MQSIREIDGSAMLFMLSKGEDKLATNKDLINALNVFPVPDQDTGTNMLHTLQVALRAAYAADKKRISSIVKASAQGALLGARGNSGVILSQLLRGFSARFDGLEIANAQQFAQALQQGVEYAYKSTVNPVEGTILTVAREAARTALHSSRKEDDLLLLLAVTVKVARETLYRTTELLPALSQYNTIDAGGKGFVLVLEGMFEALTQLSTPASIPTSAEFSHSQDLAINDIRYTQRLDGIVSKVDTEQYPPDCLYCTEVVIESTQPLSPFLQQELARWGTSIMTVDAEPVTRIHIHTSYPGQVIRSCQDLGPIINIKIDNITRQLDNPVQNYIPPQPFNSFGVIAVVSGVGLIEILRSLGSALIIDAGLEQNPQAEDLIEAIQDCPAPEIVILPHSSMSHRKAEMAAKASPKRTIIWDVVSFPQIVRALLAVQPQLPLDQNISAITTALNDVRSAIIQRCSPVQDKTRGTPATGGYCAQITDAIEIFDQNLDAIIVKLVNHLLKTEDELLSLYWGIDTAENEMAEIEQTLKRVFPEIEVESYYGGQPSCYLLITVE